MNTTIVRVFHNVADTVETDATGALRWYSFGNPVVEVFACRLPAAGAKMCADRVCDLTSECPRPGDEALASAYCARGLRPVCAGDLLRVDEAWMLCEPQGHWSIVPEPPREISDVAAVRPGTVMWRSAPGVEAPVMVTAPNLRRGDVIVAIEGKAISGGSMAVRDLVFRPGGFLDPAEPYPPDATWEVLLRNRSGVSWFLRCTDCVTIERPRPERGI